MRMTVKLTKEQEKWLNFMIDEYGGKDHLMNKHCDGGTWKGGAQSLNELSAAKMARALYDGYEVEPEFKVGDWVYHKKHHKVYQIRELSTVSNRDFVLDNDLMVTCDTIRHATESEIAQEKERRWWGKLGRKPGEYHHYDIAFDDICGVYVEVDDPNAWGNIRVANLDDKSDSREINQVHLTLVCPAENRLDGDHE